MRTISTEKAIELIVKSNGKIFSAVFRKKDGTDRMINCRLGVHKHVKGKGLKYSAKAYDLLNVFCMHSNAYRMIRLETLKTVQIQGKVFSIRD